MFGLKKYVCAKSFEQAFELIHQDKNNVILGGLLWLKMGRKEYNTGIDLSGLDTNKIIETEHAVEIGCTTRLRDVETSCVLKKYFGNIMADCVKNIVGIQFRNCATIGGSVYSKFGFSDVLTALLALETSVVLHSTGQVSLEEFITMPSKKDVLEKIIIKKQACRTAYQSLRKTATDFPVLAVGMSLCEGRWKISIGARPNRAALAKESAAMLLGQPGKPDIQAVCDNIVKELRFGNDLRGSREYRELLAKVLVKRAVEAICK